nr:hypothetical protein CFP56_12099 [Quercus suber]
MTAEADHYPIPPPLDLALPYRAHRSMDHERRLSEPICNGTIGLGLLAIFLADVSITVPRPLDSHGLVCA